MNMMSSELEESESIRRSGSIAFELIDEPGAWDCMARRRKSISESPSDESSPRRSGRSILKLLANPSWVFIPPVIELIITMSIRLSLSDVSSMSRNGIIVFISRPVLPSDIVWSIRSVFRAEFESFSSSAAPSVSRLRLLPSAPSAPSAASVSSSPRRRSGRSIFIWSFVSSQLFCIIVVIKKSDFMSVSPSPISRNGNIWSMPEPPDPKPFGPFCIIINIRAKELSSDFSPSNINGNNESIWLDWTSLPPNRPGDMTIIIRRLSLDESVVSSDISPFIMNIFINGLATIEV